MPSRALFSRRFSKRWCGLAVRAIGHLGRHEFSAFRAIRRAIEHIGDFHGETARCRENGAARRFFQTAAGSQPSDNCIGESLAQPAAALSVAAPR